MVAKHAEAHCKEMRASLEELRRSKDALQKKCECRVQQRDKKVLDLRRQLEAAQAELQKIKGNAGATESRCAVAEDARRGAEEQLKLLFAELNRESALRSDAEDRASAAEAASEMVARKLRKSETTSKAEKRHYQELQRKVAAAARHTSVASTAKISRLEQDLQKLQEREQRRKVKLNAEEEKTVMLQQQLDAAQADVQAYRKDIETERETRQRAQQNLEELQEEHKRQVEQLRLEYQQLEQQLVESAQVARLHLSSVSAAHEQQAQAHVAANLLLRDKLELLESRSAGLELAAMAAEEWRSNLFDELRRCQQSHKTEIQSVAATWKETVAAKVAELEESQSSLTKAQEAAETAEMRWHDVQSMCRVLEDTVSQLQGREAQLQTALEANTAAHKRCESAWKNRLQEQCDHIAAATATHVEALAAAREQCAVKLKQQSEKHAATLATAAAEWMAAARRQDETKSELEAQVVALEQEATRLRDESKKASNMHKDALASAVAAQQKLEEKLHQCEDERASAAAAAIHESKKCASETRKVNVLQKRLQQCQNEQKTTAEEAELHADTLAKLQQCKAAHATEMAETVTLHKERAAKQDALLMELQSRCEAAEQRERRLEADQAAELKQRDEIHTAALSEAAMAQSELKAERDSLQDALANAHAAADTVRSECGAALSAAATERQSLESQCAALQREEERQRGLSLHAAKLQAQAQAQADEVQKELAAAREAASVSCEQKVQLLAQLTTVEASLSVKGAALDEALERAERAEHESVKLQRKLQESEAARVQAWERYLEARGNLRVIARLRPVLNQGDEAAAVLLPDADFQRQRLELVSRGGAMHQAARRWRFEFDRVFAPLASNTAVFSELSEVVGAVAASGRHSVIFAYGHTGSGKTHTLSGTPSEAGIVALSVRQIFSVIETLTDWETSVDFDLLEIYNDRLADLSTTAATKAKMHGTQGALRIGEDGIVHGLVSHAAVSADEIEAAYARASRRRATKETRCNKTSSRSHFLLQLHCHQRHKASGETRSSVLQLVDLAGSERVARSGASGESLKEAQHINKSLSALGIVIEAAHRGAAHVPFRDSKLTHLMQRALRRGSLTVMIACVTSESEHAPESVRTLQFAERVNSTKLLRD